MDDESYFDVNGSSFPENKTHFPSQPDLQPDQQVDKFSIQSYGLDCLEQGGKKSVFPKDIKRCSLFWCVHWKQLEAKTDRLHTYIT